MIPITLISEVFHNLAFGCQQELFTDLNRSVWHSYSVLGAMLQAAVIDIVHYY
jgi:hypothetical protein